MRQIGTIPQRADAHRFAAYLVTQGIDAHPEESGAGWVIWVREEDQLAAARAALAEFTADPSNARYQGVERKADARLRETATKREAAKQNTVDMRNRWGASRSNRRRPLTIIVILLCAIVGVASDMGMNPENTVKRRLLFADPMHALTGWEGETLEEKLIDIRAGQWWRVITPAFLHGSAIHLALNAVMFYQLGGAVEHRRGTWRLGLLILVIALVSNLAQALVPNEWGGTTQFLGLSGVVYGLFGYLWMKSRYEPQLGLYIERGTVIILVAYLFLGFAGVLNVGNIRIANWVHGVGFLTGLMIGVAPFVFRNTFGSRE